MVIVVGEDGCEIVDSQFQEWRMKGLYARARRSGVITEQFSMCARPHEGDQQQHRLLEAIKIVAA
jgi:hypothetical protein